jgi:hypothetical protein
MAIQISGKLRIVLFGLLLVLLAAAPSVYFYQKYKSATQGASGGEEQAQEVVAKAGRHILLPTGEEPTVFTVTEKDKLSGQAFFANAKNGDLVLVYYNAKKAFLYDPVADKILEVGPVLAASPTPAPSGEQTATTPTPASIRFVLYNGTTIVGLTKTYEASLKAKVTGAEVVDRDNAAKQDYETSVLVDLTGGNPKAQEIATALGVGLGALPEGEAKPADGDFLLILGADSK